MAFRARPRSVASDAKVKGNRGARPGELRPGALRVVREDGRETRNPIVLLSHKTFIFPAQTEEYKPFVIVAQNIVKATPKLNNNELRKLNAYLHAYTPIPPPN